MQADFDSLQLDLPRLGFAAPNDMQRAFFEASADHQHMILLARTGSGKTLAYLSALLRYVDRSLRQVQAVVIVPSRELALQIEQVFRKLTTAVTVTCCYGGHRREIEENNLLERPAVVIGTPGRVADHLRRGNIDPKTITTLVLDEFDKSLELGFTAEVSEIVTALAAVERKYLVSATAAPEIPAFLRFNDAFTLDDTGGTEAPALTVELIRSPDRDKLRTLHSFLCLSGARMSVVFCNHRESVERVSDFLSDHGIVNTFYHGAMEQPQRELALAKFRNGTATILVTTDLAARGLDVPHIRYIIHYHLPSSMEVYTHRNGRTARMEASGTAVLLLGPDEELPFAIEDIKEIEIPPSMSVPPKPKWSTLFIAAGKKDKVNKVDIAGFLMKRGELRKEDVGVIEVHDRISYAAVRKSVMSETLQKIKNLRIKNKHVKIDIAK